MLRVLAAGPLCRSLLLGFALSGPVAAQAPGISVGPAVPISTAHSNDPYFETLLAINPRDPRNLVAASMVMRDGHVWNEVYSSIDGGRTWMPGRAPAGDTLSARGGDPVVFFDADGMAFFMCVGDEDNLFKSTDGGRTWRLHGRAPNHDRPFLISDQTGGTHHGRVYAVTNGGGPEIQGLDGRGHRTMALWFSTDGGRTFDRGAVLATASGTEGPFVPGELLMMPDGTLTAAFSSYTLQASNPEAEESSDFKDGHVGVAVSRDGGHSFAAIRLGPAIHYGPGIEQWQSARPVRAAVDLSSGPLHARLYLTWVDHDAARQRNVVKVTASADTGRTWSSPVTVNDTVTVGGVATPAIAVNKDGIVGLVWNDFRADSTHQCYQLYFAASADGGTTFSPNVRASERPTCPRAWGNWAPIATGGEIDPWLPGASPRRMLYVSALVPIRFQNGGDTQGLVADSAGVFHAAWINDASGAMQLWAHRFAVGTVADLGPAADASRRDLTEQLTFTVSEPVFDLAAQTVAVTVRLTNPSTTPVTGPLTLVLDQMQSALSDLRVDNADNGRPSRGAAWEMVAADDAPLLPDGQSPARVLRWSFRRQPSPDAERKPEPVRASFIILGPPKQHNDP